MSRSAVLATVLLVACGGTSTAPTTTPPTAPTPTSQTSESIGDVLPELPDGTCGGFGALATDEVAPLLGHHLQVQVLEGTLDSPVGRDIMSALPSALSESRLFLEVERTKFVVFAEEMFRRPGDDLLGAVRGLLPEGYAILRLRGAELPMIAAVPIELDTTSEAVELLQVFTVTPDDLVQRVFFLANPEAAEQQGCRQLALRLARTLAPGRRRVVTRAGERTLAGRLGITLSEDFHVGVDTGPDFSVYRIYPLLDLAAPPAWLGIYDGHHPSYRPRPGAVAIPEEMFGEVVRWEQWTAEGTLRRQLLVPSPNGSGRLHIFLGAEQAATFEELAAVAASLTASAAPVPLVDCEHVPAPTDSVEAFAGPDGEPIDPDLALLLGATRVSTLAATWRSPQVPEALAFRRLLRRPDAHVAFRRLASQATSAGKIYGLAGLYLADRDGFDGYACAARGTLDASVQRVTACGDEATSTASLLESADATAVRGERHFGEREWRAALAHGPGDLRGGGLPQLLAFGESGGEAVQRDAWRLAGGGLVPALAADADALAELVPGSPRDERARVFDWMGGGCSTRRDGRVACWGRARPGEGSDRAAVVLLPDLVRHPRAMARAQGISCMLDAEGERLCWGDIGAAARRRAAACGDTAPAAHEVLSRRPGDGPWRALGEAGGLCGLHADGSLRCFVTNPGFAPTWAELPDPGFGAAYRVPIDEPVVGMSRGHGTTAFAWTRDGDIYQWDSRLAPTQIGTFAGLAEVTGGYSGATFARLEDGRVFGWGLRRGADSYWLRSGLGAQDWAEVPALRGARLFAHSYHVCGIFDGASPRTNRVQCFGTGRGGELGPDFDEYDSPLRELPMLRGARHLVLGQRRTCGLLRGDVLRCVGAEAYAMQPGATNSASLPVDVRLPSLGRRARELGR